MIDETMFDVLAEISGRLERIADATERIAAADRTVDRLAGQFGRGA